MWPVLGSGLLKQSDSEFRNIWRYICNAAGYCILDSWSSVLAVDDR